MKLRNHMLCAALAFLAATPAVSQISDTTQVPPPGPKPTATPTPSPTPTPSCQTGNLCPGTSSVGVAGVAQFGGLASGMFAAFGSDGKQVTDSSLVGKVELAKDGAAKTDIKLTIAGPACNIACTTTRVDGTVQAWEIAGAKVTATGTHPGTTYGIVNQGQAATSAALAIQHRDN